MVSAVKTPSDLGSHLWPARSGPHPRDLQCCGHQADCAGEQPLRHSLLLCWGSMTHKQHLGIHIFDLHAADLIHTASNAMATKQTVQVHAGSYRTVASSAITVARCFLACSRFARSSRQLGSRQAHRVVALQCGRPTRQDFSSQQFGRCRSQSRRVPAQRPACTRPNRPH